MDINCNNSDKIKKIFSDFKIRELNKNSTIIHTSKKSFDSLEEYFSLGSIDYI